MRELADIRAVAWVVAAALVVCAELLDPRLIPALFWPGCYLALASGVIAHNHKHCVTFRSAALNRLWEYLLSVFYGYPVFVWGPTHNDNHHRFVNRPGDETATWRLGNHHDPIRAATYFFVSSYHQSRLIRGFLRKARLSSPRAYSAAISQYGFLATAHLAIALFAVLRHGWKIGLLTWLFAMALPAVFALWTIMFFNYEQHVHADAWSDLDHSRNFTGRVANFFLFNNGYHTAHHRNPGLHWSRLPEAHSSIEASIHADLVEPNVLSYLWRQYVLTPLGLSIGTQQLGGPPDREPAVRS